MAYDALMREGEEEMKSLLQELKAQRHPDQRMIRLAMWMNYALITCDGLLKGLEETREIMRDKADR